MLSTTSLDVVLWLQQWTPHPWLDDAAVTLTLIGDPKLLFLYLAPLLYWCLPPRLRRSVGVELLLGLVLSDVLNALLKAAARGDRPYWYSHLVKEHSVTCESGFGMPSGHMMVATTVAGLLLNRVTPRWKFACTVAAVVFLTLLAITRQYVGSHFLGQVVAGTLCGILLARAIVRYQLEARVSAHFLALQRRCVNDRTFLLRAVWLGVLASLLILTVALLELAFVSLWADPLLSLQLAREGCEATRAAALGFTSAEDDLSAAAVARVAEQARFQMERGPLMGVVRDAGVCVGGALALALIQLYSLDGAPPSPSSSSPRASSESEVADLLPAPASRVKSASGAHMVSALAVVARGAFGLLEAHLLRQLLVRVSEGCVSLLFGASPPSIVVFAQNYMVFAAITLNYLAIVPWMSRHIAQRIASRPTRW